jgi:uncharacterized protein YbaA (DUF1428 family)
MNYVDGFLVAVPNAKRQTYIDHAARFARLFKQHGALRVVECWGDDVPEGKLTSFPMAVKREPEESVVFSWIEWPSRAVRDAGMAKVMADPAMQSGADAMPFDGKRMVFGGFQAVVEA